MSFRKEPSREVKWRERRRGLRLNSQVHITIEWETGDGRKLREEAITRIVSPYGCLVVLRSDLPLDHHVQLTNLDNRQSAGAAVVWKGNERAEGREHGIELVNPEMDFWGLEL